MQAVVMCVRYQQGLSSLENGLMFTCMSDTGGHAAMSPVTEDTWQNMRHPIPVVSPMSCCTADVLCLYITLHDVVRCIVIFKGFIGCSSTRSASKGLPCTAGGLASRLGLSVTILVACVARLHSAPYQHKCQSMTAVSHTSVRTLNNSCWPLRQWQQAVAHEYVRQHCKMSDLITHCPGAGLQRVLAKPVYTNLK
jgi:hypothetical protein